MNSPYLVDFFPLLVLVVLIFLYIHLLTLSDEAVHPFDSFTHGRPLGRHLEQAQSFNYVMVLLCLTRGVPQEHVLVLELKSYA